MRCLGGLVFDRDIKLDEKALGNLKRKLKSSEKKESIANIPEIVAVMNSTTEIPLIRYEKGDNVRGVRCEGVHDLHESDNCYEWCVFYKEK